VRHSGDDLFRLLKSRFRKAACGMSHRVATIPCDLRGRVQDRPESAADVCTSSSPEEGLRSRRQRVPASSIRKTV